MSMTDKKGTLSLKQKKEEVIMTGIQDTDNNITTRDYDDNVNKPRKTIEDIFKEFDPTSINYSGEISCKVPKGLFPANVTMEPSEIQKFRDLGYRPKDEVLSEMGETVDGTHQHHSGVRTKWFVCSEAQREQRHQLEKSNRESVNRAVFSDEPHGVPLMGDLKEPPPGYTGDGTDGFF